MSINSMQLGYFQKIGYQRWKTVGAIKKQGKHFFRIHPALETA
jgi:hypothetical protein